MNKDQALLKVTRKKFNVMNAGLSNLINEATEVKREFNLPRNSPADILVTQVIRMMRELVEEAKQVRVDSPGLDKLEEPPPLAEDNIDIEDLLS